MSSVECDDDFDAADDDRVVIVGVVAEGCDGRSARPDPLKADPCPDNSPEYGHERETSRVDTT